MQIPLADAAFLRLDSQSTPMHVAMLLTFTLPAGAKADFVKRLHDELARQAVTSAPFNLRLASTNSAGIAQFWETDGAVDLGYHLRRAALPYPGSERELGLLLERLHSVPLDHGRPMWELVLIEGLGGGTRFALYMKIHHAMGDGMALMGMITRSLSHSARAKALAPWALPALPETADADPDPGEAARAWRQWLEHLVASPLPASDLLPHGPRCVLNGDITARRRFATQSLELSRVKAIGRATDTTVNDVVMALVSDVLRRYLAEYDHLPTNPLMAGVPVAVPGARRNGAANALGSIFASLATHLDDPLERLHAIHATMGHAKAEVQHVPAAVTSAVNAFGMFMAALIPPGQVTPASNLTVSNVPGPRESLYLRGAQLDGMYPVSLLVPDQRVNITLLGYRDRLFFGIIGCPDRLPGMQRMAVMLPDALDSLERALGLRRKQGSATKAKAAKQERPAS